MFWNLTQEIVSANVDSINIVTSAQNTGFCSSIKSLSLLSSPVLPNHPTIRGTDWKKDFNYPLAPSVTMTTIWQLKYIHLALLSSGSHLNINDHQLWRANFLYEYCVSRVYSMEIEFFGLCQCSCEGHQRTRPLVQKALLQYLSLLVCTNYSMHTVLCTFCIHQ